MEDRRTVWNRAHEAHAEGPLSGSDAAEVLRHHGLDSYDHRGATGTVLDIGVGLGNASRYFRILGYTVDALDVADLAEPTVREWVRHFYLDSELETLPAGEYDLAVSHLVAQHMAEPALRRQILWVSRALKPGGLFSLHLAGSRIDGENNWTRADIPDGFDGRMCRTEEYAFELVKRVVGDGYNVGYAGHVKDWPEFRSYWFYIHIRRAA
jgi:SAM-dependent methyltransferase